MSELIVPEESKRAKVVRVLAPGFAPVYADESDVSLGASANVAVIQQGMLGPRAQVPVIHPFIEIKNAWIDALNQCPTMRVYGNLVTQSVDAPDWWEDRNASKNR